MNLFRHKIWDTPLGDVLGGEALGGGTADYFALTNWFVFEQEGTKGAKGMPLRGGDE